MLHAGCKWCTLLNNGRRELTHATFADSQACWDTCHQQQVEPAAECPLIWAGCIPALHVELELPRESVDTLERFVARVDTPLSRSTQNTGRAVHDTCEGTTMTTTSTTATSTTGTAVVQATMEQIEQLVGAAEQVKLRGRLLDAQVTDRWVERAAVDETHSLHAKPGEPHWHLWISADHQDPGTADNPYSIVQDASYDLESIADDLAEHAHLLECKRDAVAEMDGVELHETEDGARLMAKLVEINWNIKEAARVRACANELAALARNARKVSGWAFMPPLLRPAPYARKSEAENTRLMRRRLDHVIDTINALGEKARASEGHGFRITECPDAACEIAAAARAENNETEPAVNA